MTYRHVISLDSIDKQKRHFDRVAGMYQAMVDYDKYRLDYEIIRNYSEGHNNINVLDLATGTGKIAIGLMLNYEELIVYGLDISLEMLHSAQKKVNESAALKERYRLVQGNILNLGFKNNSFGLISIGYAFHHVQTEQRLSALKEAHRVLSKNGTIAIMEVGKRHFEEAIQNYCGNDASILEPRMQVQETELLLRKANFRLIASVTKLEYQEVPFSYVKDYFLVQGIPMVANRTTTIQSDEKIMITEHRFICIGRKD